MSTGRRCHGIPRRELLRVGGLTALGLGLGDFFRLGRTAAADAREVLAISTPTEGLLHSLRVTHL